MVIRSPNSTRPMQISNRFRFAILTRSVNNMRAAASSIITQVARMEFDDSRWNWLIEGLRNGDRDALAAFCQQYGDALRRIADRKLPNAVRRRIDPEDVVQSVCRTFFRRANEGEFHLGSSGELWRLLCAITLTKVHEQTRFHLRQKRGVNRESEPEPRPDEDSVIHQPAAAEPSPAHAAQFADQFQQLLQQLEPNEQRIVDLKLQEFTNEQIAEQLQCSERTVRRILKRVQAVLAQLFTIAVSAESK